jgi:thiol-disulfide isomerase/thioredoxin
MTTVLPDFGPAPELAGISDWINTEPTSLAALRGTVVLVHFWTFACVNCRNLQPHVKAWYARYGGDDFTVLSVHTPELAFERDLDNLRRAIAEKGVRYPVAVDPDFRTWDAYRNRYWPAFYFIDRRGHIRHTQFGEGGYDRAEAVIRELIAEAPPESGEEVDQRQASPA